MREFGLLKALGLKPLGIIRDVLTEAGLLLVMGMLIGNALAALSVWALAGTGIDLSALAAGAEFAGISRTIYPALQIRDLVDANLVVLALGLAVSLYPAVKAARITPVAALAHT
jgi:ABC-type antimicrobial peptide transport system permease subunit